MMMNISNRNTISFVSLNVEFRRSSNYSVCLISYAHKIAVHCMSYNISVPFRVRHFSTLKFTEAKHYDHRAKITK